METTRECSECHRSKPEYHFVWTHDRYGIPWKKVCTDCADKVEEEICERFEFDAADAGECLEPEDY